MDKNFKLKILSLTAIVIAREVKYMYVMRTYFIIACIMWFYFH